MDRLRLASNHVQYWISLSHFLFVWLQWHFSNTVTISDMHHANFVMHLSGEREEGLGMAVFNQECEWFIEKSLRHTRFTSNCCVFKNNHDFTKIVKTSHKKVSKSWQPTTKHQLYRRHALQAPYLRPASGKGPNSWLPHYWPTDSTNRLSNLQCTLSMFYKGQSIWDGRQKFGKNKGQDLALSHILRDEKAPFPLINSKGR